MAHAVQSEILDLRHFSAGALRPLLEEEATIWSERLHWDYRASAKLLLDYLNGRILPGFVAVEGQRVVGYAFCVYEGDKAVIGDVFGTESAAGEAAVHIEGRLLDSLIELLQHSPGVDRIETQLLLHPHGRFQAAFDRAGFSTYERLFMECPLDLLSPAVQLPSTMEIPLQALELRPWRESDFSAAGRLITQAYKGHLDSTINDQYRTISGSLRFLHNIVRFPGCGIFDPTTSLVLAYRERDELGGMLLCSRVSEGTGHVTQLCIAPSLRHKGIGKMLLSHCFRELGSRGFSFVTLTVTESNRNAVALYRECGFSVRHTFDAMVWDRRSAQGLPLSS